MSIKLEDPKYSPEDLTMKSRLLRTVLQRQLPIRVCWVVLLPELSQTLHFNFLRHSKSVGSRVEQVWALVLSEAQNNIDAVDTVANGCHPTFHHLREVAGREAAVVHHVHSI